MKQKQSTQRKRTIRQSLMLLLACMLTGHAFAQYIPPTAYEDTYPAGAPWINWVNHTSNYSISIGNLSGVPVDVVLSGWDAPGQPAAMAWRLLQHGSVSTVVNQGLQMYPNCQDIEVGLVSGSSPADYAVVVAYYKVGVGHFVDVYKLTLGGMGLNYTMMLSAAPNHTRISIDSHKMYGIAITWEDKGYIMTKVGLATGGPITWSGTLLLNGSKGDREPDCAFSHTPMAGTLNVHYAYYDPSTLSEVESSYDFWTMIYMTGGFVPVAVNDVNYVGPVNMPPVNLDCPDHYDVENWAYTYTPNSQDIVVRFIDYHTTATPTSVSVNSGVLGNAPNNMTQNVNPVVAYDHDCIMGIGTMYVGWTTYDIDPGTGQPAGYVSLQMTEDGMTLVTPPDYLSVANNPVWGLKTPALCFSKQNDMSDYLYTTFPEYNYSSPNFEMEHKYHPWNTPSFKNPNKIAYACNDDENISNFVNHKVATPHITAYPDPFTDRLAISVPADLQNETSTVSVTDMTGRQNGQFTGKLVDVNNYLTSLSKDLPAGNYLLNVSITGKTKETIKITKTN